MLHSAHRRASKRAREDAKLTAHRLEKEHRDYYVAWAKNWATQELLNSEYAAWQESLNEF